MSLELAARTLAVNVTVTAQSVPLLLPPGLASWAHELAVQNTGTGVAYVSVGAAAAVPAPGGAGGGYPVAPGATAILHAPEAGFSSLSVVGASATTVLLTCCEEAV